MSHTALPVVIDGGHEENHRDYLYGEEQHNTSAKSPLQNLPHAFVFSLINKWCTIARW